jgi:hypothetical protein
MKHELEYLADKDIVLLKTSGSYKFEKEFETIKKALAKLTEHNCKRLLVDHRAANVNSGFINIYERPNVYDDIGINKFISAACVYSELNSDLRFYEDVCQNRGWNVRVFDDYAAAIEWLLKQKRII